MKQKPKVIKSYENLSEELLAKIKLAYPKGYSRYLVYFNGKDGEKLRGLPLETEEVSYLIKMPVIKVEQPVEDDEIFEDEDDEAGLKSKIREKYLEGEDEEMGFLDINITEEPDFDMDI